MPVLLGPTRGHRFAPQGVRGSLAIAVGRYEPAVTRFLREHLAGAHAFFDVGAHTGYFTRLALRAMPDGVVVAFEPDTAWHDALRSLDGARVVLRTDAVGRADGTGTLVSAPGVCSRLEDAIPPTSAPTTDDNTTSVRSLDSLVEHDEVPAPDVMKIDIEGSEVRALEGAATTLRRLKALAVECHSMPLLRDVLDVTIAAGFDQIRSTSGGDGLGPPTVLACRADGGEPSASRQ